MTPSITVPAEMFVRLVQAARAWQRLVEWENAERQAGEPALPEYISRRRLVSVEDCAVCGAAVTLRHPWRRWQIALLPDLSWVRCEGCADSAPPAKGAA